MKKENNHHYGLNFAEGLTLVFIVLKLCKVISWSWLWVLSPLWIGFAIGLIILLIASLFL
jgi:hypothetical protein